MQQAVVVGTYQGKNVYGVPGDTPFAGVTTTSSSGGGGGSTSTTSTTTSGTRQSELRSIGGITYRHYFDTGENVVVNPGQTGIQSGTTLSSSQVNNLQTYGTTEAPQTTQTTSASVQLQQPRSIQEERVQAARQQLGMTPKQAWESGLDTRQSIGTTPQISKVERSYETLGKRTGGQTVSGAGGKPSYVIPSGGRTSSYEEARISAYGYQDTASLYNQFLEQGKIRAKQGTVAAKTSTQGGMQLPIEQRRAAVNQVIASEVKMERLRQNQQSLAQSKIKGMVNEQQLRESGAYYFGKPYYETSTSATSTSYKGLLGDIGKTSSEFESVKGQIGETNLGITKLNKLYQQGEISAEEYTAKVTPLAEKNIYLSGQQDILFGKLGELDIAAKTKGLEYSSEVSSMLGEKATKIYKETMSPLNIALPTIQAEGIVSASAIASSGKGTKSTTGERILDLATGKTLKKDIAFAMTKEARFIPTLVTEYKNASGISGKLFSPFTATGKQLSKSETFRASVDIGTNLIGKQTEVIQNVLEPQTTLKLGTSPEQNKKWFRQDITSEINLIKSQEKAGVIRKGIENWLPGGEMVTGLASNKVYEQRQKAARETASLFNTPMKERYELGERTTFRSTFSRPTAEIVALTESEVTGEAVGQGIFRGMKGYDKILKTGVIKGIAKTTPGMVVAGSAEGLVGGIAMQSSSPTSKRDYAFVGSSAAFGGFTAPVANAFIIGGLSAKETYGLGTKKGRVGGRIAGITSTAVNIVEPLEPIGDVIVSGAFPVYVPTGKKSPSYPKGTQNIFGFGTGTSTNLLGSQQTSRFNFGTKTGSPFMTKQKTSSLIGIKTKQGTETISRGGWTETPAFGTKITTPTESKVEVPTEVKIQTPVETKVKTEVKTETKVPVYTPNDIVFPLPIVGGGGSAKGKGFSWGFGSRAKGKYKPGVAGMALYSAFGTTGGKSSPALGLRLVPKSWVGKKSTSSKSMFGKSSSKSIMGGTKKGSMFKSNLRGLGL